MSKSKYLDLAGLTAYDRMLKEWFKSGVVDITDDAIRALFAIPYPANNEIWYTSWDGNVVNPSYTDEFGANIVSNTYENGKGVITFDGDVTMIAYSAFSGCDGLTSVTIPNSVTSIRDYAFKGCFSLTSITIPNSITSIGSIAFGFCSALTSITIPNSVTSIGDRAFYDCSGLTSITFEGTTEEWDVVSKGDSWNYLVPATNVQCTDGQVPLQ
jgi:hypothetical protein